jgi:hypothetical protein
VSEAIVKTYALQLARGLAHLHGRRMLHRDLKPDNILIAVSASGERTVKIADMGLATTLASRTHATAHGTPLYISPEALRDGVKHTSDDMWALGIVIVEMLLGGLSGDGIPAADMRAVDDMVRRVSASVRDRALAGVVEGLLSMDETTRFKASRVVVCLEGEGEGVAVRGARPRVAGGHSVLRLHGLSIDMSAGACACVCVFVCVACLTCAVCRLRWVVGALRARGDACHEDEHPHLQVCVCLSVCVTPSLPPSPCLALPVRCEMGGRQATSTQSVTARAPH